MARKTNGGLGFFSKYLTIWVILCMIIGVLISRFLPFVPEFLGAFEYASVSILIVGVLVEVPVMLILVKIANATRTKFPGNTPGDSS
jgi:ACR3 family arsenite transporter